LHSLGSFLNEVGARFLTDTGHEGLKVIGISGSSTVFQEFGDIIGG
jgi:hypothetical protein